MSIIITRIIIMSTNELLSCDGCGYAWRPRVPSPVSCPECKGRLSKQRPLRAEDNAESASPASTQPKAPTTEPVYVRTDRYFDRRDRVWITKGLDDQGKWHVIDREQVDEGA